MSAALRTILMSTVFAVASASAVAAGKITTVPVHFTKGASSATLKGSFSGYDSVQYTISASAGQTMAVKVTGSSNANFNVLPVGGVAGETSAIATGYVGADWSGTLPASGTYTVDVYQMRASARRGEKVSFTIHIAITGKGKPAADASTTGTSGHVASEKHDASGTIPCARYAGQPTTQCEFTVSREQGGTATVWVTYADGFKRAIFFENGNAIGADQSQADGDMAFSSSKESDLFFIRVGKERYEITEAVIFGG